MDMEMAFTWWQKIKWNGSKCLAFNWMAWYHAYPHLALRLFYTIEWIDATVVKKTT